MDLLLILRKIWRHKFVTLPIIVLTLAGAAYTVAVKKPNYQASASYLLINPPAPPTPEDIAADPALAKVHANNPYTSFGNLSVVIDVLARTMTSVTAKKELLRAGASPTYAVQSAADFGSTTPIAQITADAPSPGAAVRSAHIVGDALVGELDRMQRVQNVDQRYRIKTTEVQSPGQPELRASGQLRMLVGVFVLGGILLFVALTIADAIDTLLKERRGVVPVRSGMTTLEAVPGPTPHPLPDPRPHPLAAPDAVVPINNGRATRSAGSWDQPRASS